jgi:ketosteroid isomerase-like protein
MSGTDAPELLRVLYRAFNARDIETVLKQMASDVDWPNAWEGGRIRGRPAVRDYWTRQWAAIDPDVEPTGFAVNPNGSITVHVDQTVRALDGTVISVSRVDHVFTLRGGLIARMDVEEPTATA